MHASPLLGVLLLFAQNSIPNNDDATFDRFWTAPDYCGGRAVFHLARLVGVEVSLEQVSAALPITGKETSFAELASALNVLGIRTRGFKYSTNTSEENLGIGVARIALNRRSHYVVVAGVRGKKILLLDGASLLRVDVASFRKMWDGNVLKVVGATDSEERSGRGRGGLLAAIGAAVALVGFASLRRIGTPALMLAAAALFGCSKGDQNAGPTPSLTPETARAVVDRTTMDDLRAGRSFGDFKTSRVVTGFASFVLENPMAVPVAIDHVEKKCGCQAVALDRSPLQPGEKRPFRISMSNIPIADSSQSIEISWSTETGRRGTLRCNVEFARLAEPPLMVTREPIHVGMFHKRESFSTTFTFETWEHHGAEAWIKALARERDGFQQIDVSRLPQQPGQPSRYLVLWSGLLEGRHPVAEQVGLIDSKACVVAKLEVRAAIEPLVRASPDVVYAFIDDPVKASRIKRRLIVSKAKATGMAFDPLLKHPPPEWIEVRRLRAEPGETDKASFEVLIDPATRTTDAKKSANLRWTCEGNDEITVDVVLDYRR